MTALYWTVLSFVIALANARAWFTTSKPVSGWMALVCLLCALHWAVVWVRQRRARR